MGLDIPDRAEREVDVRVVTAEGRVVTKRGIRRPLQKGRDLQKTFRRAVNQHVGEDVIDVETGKVIEVPPPVE